MKPSSSFPTVAALLIPALTLAGAGCRPNPDADPTFGPQQFTIALTTPPDVPLTTVALGASGSVAIGQRARVIGLGMVVPAATNMGNGGVAAGSDSALGDLWSASRVKLEDRARVAGSVHAAELTSGVDVVMAGPVDRAPKLTPPRTVSWTVAYAETRAKVTVDADKTATLSPDQYGAVQLASGSTLTLQSGTYLF